MNVPVVKEVPVPDLKHPAPKYDMLPKHEVNFLNSSLRWDL